MISERRKWYTYIVTIGTILCLVITMGCIGEDEENDDEDGEEEEEDQQDDGAEDDEHDDEEKEDEPPGELEFFFSYGPCGGSLDSDEGSDDDGSEDVEATWVDDNTLNVTATIIINCAEEILNGSYDMDGDKITLYYESPRCEVCADCVCDHVLSFQFENIEKKDYEYEVIRLE